MFGSIFGFITIQYFNQNKQFTLFKKIRQNNKRIVIFRSEKMMQEYLKNFSGISAFRNLRFITLISISKLLDNLFDLWRSPIRAFRLYRFETLNNKCTSSLDVLPTTSVVMLFLLLIILVSRKLQGFTSMVKSIFG